MRRASRVGDVGEFDGDALGGVLGVEEDVEAGRLADGLVDVLGVLDHVEGDGVVRDGLKGDGSGDGADLGEAVAGADGLLEGVGGGERGRGGRGVGVLRGELLAGGGDDGSPALDEGEFLGGGLVGGIDLEGSLELVDGAADVSGLLEDAAAVGVGRRGGELRGLEVGLVAEVGGLFEVGLAEGLVGGVVVFAGPGILTALVPGFGGLGRGGDGEGEEEGDRSCSEEGAREEGDAGMPTSHASVSILYGGSGRSISEARGRESGTDFACVGDAWGARALA